ncbi:MAG: DNA internalization-related competence protein ComEC/Rec2 [Desulfobulbaceae bacterium]|nr:DNA internalization-related competence protein ComEC/Rec2 [Desulfobulbaceae bacterium]
MNIIVPVAVCYILGASAAGLLLPGHSPLGYITGLAVALAAVLFVFRNHRDALLYTLPLFFLLGLAHTGRALHPPGNPDHIYNLITEKSTVTLTGTVASMPEFDGQTTRMEMEVDSLLPHQQKPENSGMMPATGRVRISVEGRLPDGVSPGDHLLAVASLYRTAGYQTPGVFNYPLYLANRSIYVTGKINSPAAIIPYIDLSGSRYQNIIFYPERIRYAVNNFLEASLAPETAALYKALLIGSRTGISEATLESFKASGCMHLLAISGLHMGLLGMFILLIFTWIMKRSTYLLNHIHVPAAAALLSLPFLFSYAFIAGMNTPVLRALIMSIFFLFGVILRRQRSIIHIVAAAALLLLLIKPLALFTVSFQLSFSSVLAIALLYPRILVLLERKKSTARSKVSAYVAAAFCVSLAATLGSLPIMLFHFNRFSLIGPFMNLLIEPLLCLWALPLGLASLPLALLSPEAAVFLLKTGSQGIGAALAAADLGSRIPFASLWSITPSPAEIVLYYGILLLWFSNASLPWRKSAALTFSVLLALYFTRGLWPAYPGNITEISFLDIGQGSSTFIRMPGGRTVLLDGGNNSTSPSFDAGESVIAPFLWKKKVWRLDDLVISHPHSDHYSGLPFIIRRFQPKRLWINGRETESWPYRDLLETASLYGIPVIAAGRTELEFSDNGAVLTGLNNDGSNAGSMKKETDLSVNDRSLVLSLRHGEYSFLFPGDISTVMEGMLVDSGADLQAEVLLAPHHGSGGSGSKRFIAAVDPEIIVVSAGRNNPGLYPSTKHLQNWQAQGRSVMETSRAGTITVTTDGSRLQVTTYARPAAAGRDIP